MSLPRHAMLHAKHFVAQPAPSHQKKGSCMRLRRDARRGPERPGPADRNGRLASGPDNCMSCLAWQTRRRDQLAGQPRPSPCESFSRQRFRRVLQGPFCDAVVPCGPGRSRSLSPALPCMVRPARLTPRPRAARHSQSHSRRFVLCLQSMGTKTTQLKLIVGHGSQPPGPSLLYQSSVHERSVRLPPRFSPLSDPSRVPGCDTSATHGT